MKPEPGSTTEHDVRLEVYRHFVSAGRAPAIDEVAKALALGREALCEAFESLERGHVLVLRPDTREVWMAMPFSAVPTAFSVAVGEQRWWANGAWDALGVPAMLRREATIVSSCPVTGEEIRLEVGLDGPAFDTDRVVHFALPTRRWWDDIGETGATILLFRSEEDLRTWCEKRGQPVGGVLSLQTAWRLAQAWYHDRLDPAWRRKTGTEVKSLFDELGMTGEFWALG